LHQIFLWYFPHRKKQLRRRTSNERSQWSQQSWLLVAPFKKCSIFSIFLFLHWKIFQLKVTKNEEPRLSSKESSHPNFRSFWLLLAAAYERGSVGLCILLQSRVFINQGGSNPRSGGSLFQRLLPLKEAEQQPTSLAAHKLVNFVDRSLQIFTSSSGFEPILCFTVICWC